MQKRLGKEHLTNIVLLQERYNMKSSSRTSHVNIYRSRGNSELSRGIVGKAETKVDVPSKSPS